MAWSFENPLVRVQIDALSKVRIVSHQHYPFDGNAGEKPRALVVRYLTEIAEVLGLSRQAIDHLREDEERDVEVEGPPSRQPGLQLRWMPGFRVRDETLVLFLQQTHAATTSSDTPLDVRSAGLRIFVHGGSAARITSTNSTLEFAPIDLEGSDGVLLTLDKKVDLNDVLASFGFRPLPPNLLEHAMSAPFVHRFRRRDGWVAESDDDLVEGKFYPARSVRVLPLSSSQHLQPYELTWWPRPAWVDAHGQQMVEKIVPLKAVRLSANSHSIATGLGEVFEVDPVTRTGDFEHARPNSSAAQLNMRRVAVPLPNLLPPTAGMPWTLSGANVDVLDTSKNPQPGGLGAPAPTNAALPIFLYGARTNEFAAVNAYYHLDRMLSKLEDFGLPFASFPMNMPLPLQVIHRAALHPGVAGDGKGVNGQTMIVPIPPSNEPTAIQFRFGLADLSRNPGSIETPVEPLGIACDSRVVWHEFCHALIAASTGYLEFPFVHSAGDALAAIQCDPESLLAQPPFPEVYRGLTFPWSGEPLRRHIRPLEEGWSWVAPFGRTEPYADDTRDMFGYLREQIMSSTLFRLYRTIGGDALAGVSPVLVVRRTAADYATYLIVRGIKALGNAQIVTTPDAATFANAMIEADIGTVIMPVLAAPDVFRAGGTVWKTIEWAFEKQGLPRFTTSSLQPRADVYIDDGRAGEYDYVEQWHAVATALWLRNNPDGLTGDDVPRRGVDNFVYVSVANRGLAPAKTASVSVYTALDASGLEWPDATRWTPLALHPGALGVKDQNVPSDGLVFGPYVWRPEWPWPTAILAVAECDTDLSNINPSGGLPCATQPSRLETLVRLDNNLGLRVLDVP